MCAVPAEACISAGRVNPREARTWIRGQGPPRVKYVHVLSESVESMEGLCGGDRERVESIEGLSGGGLGVEGMGEPERKSKRWRRSCSVVGYDRESQKIHAGNRK